MGTLVILGAVFIGIVALVIGFASMLRTEPAGAAEGRLDMLTSTTMRPGDRDAKQKKGLLSQPLDDMPHWSEEFFSRFLNIRTMIDQAGLTIQPSRFIAVSVALFCLGMTIYLFTGFPFYVAPLAGAGLGILPLCFVIFKRKKRLSLFARQMPGALELIARALRAGHSLAAGFQLVGNEVDAPLGQEFRRAYEEQNLGITLEDSLLQMADRVPNLDLRFFVTAVILQRQTGGDLAEILDKIGELVRARFKIYGAIQALTGEGRLSGIVLTALPPGMFVTMLYLNPKYIMMLFEDPLGIKMLIVAIFLQILGALVIRKIVNIKV